jgi:hypothetical protein
MRHFTLLPVLVCFLPVAAAAQGRPTVTPADYGKWESLGAAALSPDGRWLAYTVTRVDEHTEIRLRRLDRDTTIVVSQASAPVFTANSRWLAYTISVTPAEREKLEKEKKPVRTSTGLLDLSSGTRTTLATSSSHRFSADGNHLAVRLVPVDAAKRDAADLLVRDLATGAMQTFGNVSS